MPAAVNMYLLMRGSWMTCCWAMQHGDAVTSGPFEDEETKALYESLPDIRALVPALLLGPASEQQEAADAEPDQAQDGDPKAHDTEGVPSSAAQADEEGIPDWSLTGSLLVGTPLTAKSTSDLGNLKFHHTRHHAI